MQHVEGLSGCYSPHSSATNFANTLVLGPYRKLTSTLSWLRRLIFRAKPLFDHWSPSEIIAHLRANSAVSPLVVRLAGIEPTTLGFGGQYSSTELQPHSDVASRGPIVGCFIGRPRYNPGSIPPYATERNHERTPHRKHPG